jgi:hypothetical protein
MVFISPPFVGRGWVRGRDVVIAAGSPSPGVFAVGSAARVERGPGAGADARGLLHRSLSRSGNRISRRSGPSRPSSRRAPSSMSSSRPPDQPCPGPPEPTGHIPGPSAARTCVVVFISCSRVSAVAAAGAGAPVRADAGALSGADVRGGLHLGLLCPGSAAAGAGPRAGAGAAVRADAGAFTGANVRGRVHRALLVCRLSRGGRGRGLRRRGCGWWRASWSRSVRVNVPVRGWNAAAMPAVTASGRRGGGSRRAAADAGRSVGSVPPVRASRCRRCACRCRRECSSAASSSQPPFGSTPRPFPARTVVCVFIAPTGCRAE